LREQEFELRVFGVVDIIDDVGEPFLGIDVVFGAGGKKTVKHGNLLGCLMRSGKEIVLPTQCQAANK